MYIYIYIQRERESTQPENPQTDELIPVLQYRQKKNYLLFTCIFGAKTNKKRSICVPSQKINKKYTITTNLLTFIGLILALQWGSNPPNRFVFNLPDRPQHRNGAGQLSVKI